MTHKEIEQIAEAVADILRKTVPLSQKEFLSLDEAAQYAGLTKSALYKLTHNKQIPFSKPNGKMCYFKRTDIENWMMSNPVATAEDIAEQANSYCMKNKANI